MSNYVVSDTTLTAVANAIRSRTGKSEQIEYADGFVSEINGMIGKDYLDGHLVDSVASAPVASFPDGANGQPMKVTITLTPIQSGSGDPYPPGGGKNKFDKSTATENTYINSGGNTSGSSGWSVSDYIPASENTTYTLSGSGATGTAAYTGFYNASKGVISTVVNTQTTFTTPAGTAYIRVSMLSANINTTQLETGSIATPYAPYSNIRPITGHDGVTVSRTGVNILDNTGIEVTTNNLRIARNSGYGKPLLLKGGVTYTFYCNSATRPDGIYIIEPFTSTNIWLQNVSPSITVTPTKDTLVGVNFYWATERPDDATGLCCVIGATASSYSAYSGTTYPFTFPTPPGTVYGGTLTIHQDGTGTLVVDRAMLDTTWGSGYGATDLGTCIRKAFPITGGVSGQAKSMCNCTAYLYSFGEDSPHYWVNNSTQVYVVLPENTDNSFGIQVIYELATPVTYQLTNQQVIETLEGVNNVWASTGNVAVKYSPDTDLWIQKVLAGESA